jgi:hypothetical protein
MEVEAQPHQYVVYTDFQSLLDRATEDDGLDLFDEAPRYNTDNAPSICRPYRLPIFARQSYRGFEQ